MSWGAVCCIAASLFCCYATWNFRVIAKAMSMGVSVEEALGWKRVFEQYAISGILDYGQLGMLAFSFVAVVLAHNVPKETGKSVGHLSLRVAALFALALFFAEFSLESCT